MRILTIAPLWVASVTWHLWRVMTMRPAYRYIGDTFLPVVSFGLVFLVTGASRRVMGGDTLMGAFFEQVLLGLFLCLLAERRHRSSSLCVAFMAASIVVDLVAGGLFVAGVLKTPQLPFMAGGLWQAALMLAAYVQFRQEPLEVQATGYRPDGKASVLQA